MSTHGGMWRGTRLSERRCFVAHIGGLGLQAGIIVDGRALHELGGGLYAAFALLDDVPGFVREVLFLAGADVDVVALGVGKRLHLGGGGGVIVDANVGKVVAGEAFDAAFEAVGHARAVRRGRHGALGQGIEQVGLALPLEGGGGGAAIGRMPFGFFGGRMHSYLIPKYTKYFTVCVEKYSSAY